MDVIETERLRLERLSERDRADVTRMCQDARVMRWVRDGSPMTPEAAEERFRRAVALWETHGVGWRAARTRASGDWVGVAALQPAPEGTEGIVPGTIEIGWWVEPDLWGAGYATEAALAVRDEAFTALGLDRLIARIRPENAPSASVATKLGMRHDMRTYDENGDVDIYALDRPA